MFITYPFPYRPRLRILINRASEKRMTEPMGNTTMELENFCLLFECVRIREDVK